MTLTLTTTAEDAPRLASRAVPDASKCACSAWRSCSPPSLSLLSPYFLTANNLFNILDQSVVIGIVAVGMTFVILTGGIDLSVGSVAGLTGHHPRPRAAGLSDPGRHLRWRCWPAPASG